MLLENGVPMAMDDVDHMRTREVVLGYRMGAELSAVAVEGGELDVSGRLVQLSLEHLTLRLTRPTHLRPGQTANVVVGVGEPWMTALEAEVVAAAGDSETEGGLELSLRFVAPPLAMGRRIVSLLEGLRDEGKLVSPQARPIWKEHIGREDRIARIFDALAARRCRGVARTADGEQVELTAAFFDRYEGRMAWEVSRGLPRTPFVMEVFGYSSVLHFDVEQVEYASGVWTMPLPREVVRYRHRWLRRAAVWGECEVRFSHPLWPQLRVGRQVLDVSYEGLAFCTEPGEDLVYPGLKLPELEVVREGHAPVRLRAEVRNVQRTEHGQRCGLTVVPASPEEALGWWSLVEELSHPGTRVAGNWHQGTWELFERSGYFRLSGKTPEAFRRLQAEYGEAYARLEGRRQLGCRVVRPLPQGGVEASLSWLKPYSGCWLGHQLARQASKGDGARTTAREALRDIYMRGLEPTLMDPEVKWFLAYCEANVRWVRFTVFDFGEWYESTGRTCLLPFRFMEGRTEPGRALPEGYTLGEPTEAERQALFARLRALRPVAYQEALDLVPERFDLAATRRQWQEAGLERERGVMVARKDGRALAVGILETAHPGLNLFHVLDGIRMVPLVDESSPEAQEAQEALLVGAAEWYRQRGRAVFVHYVETEHVAYTERAGLEDLGEGRMFIMSTQLLPEFLEHLCEATTPRAEH
jgi:hypothetical protein